MEKIANVRKSSVCKSNSTIEIFSAIEMDLSHFYARIHLRSSSQRYTIWHQFQLISFGALLVQRACRSGCVLPRIESHYRGDGQSCECNWLWHKLCVYDCWLDSAAHHNHKPIQSFHIAWDTFNIFRQCIWQFDNISQSLYIWPHEMQVEMCFWFTFLSANV